MCAGTAFSVTRLTTRSLVSRAAWRLLVSVARSSLATPPSLTSTWWLARAVSRLVLLLSLHTTWSPVTLCWPHPAPPDVPRPQVLARLLDLVARAEHRHHGS